jgi:hypothetical protein
MSTSTSTTLTRSKLKLWISYWCASLMQHHATLAPARERALVNTIDCVRRTRGLALPVRRLHDAHTRETAFDIYTSGRAGFTAREERCTEDGKDAHVRLVFDLLEELRGAMGRLRARRYTVRSLDTKSPDQQAHRVHPRRYIHTLRQQYALDGERHCMDASLSIWGAALP